MGLFDWVKNKQEEKRKEKEAEEELRRQAEQEVSDEVIKIRKEKIKQQILAEARGEKKPEDSKGLKMLKQLGDEFKTANLGNNEQMEKLLGRKSTAGIDTSKISPAGSKFGSTSVGGNDKIPGNDKIAELLGSAKRKANTEIISEGSHGVTTEKLREYLGKKKK